MKAAHQSMGRELGFEIRPDLAALLAALEGESDVVAARAEHAVAELIE